MTDDGFDAPNVVDLTKYRSSRSRRGGKLAALQKQLDTALLELDTTDKCSSWDGMVLILYHRANPDDPADIETTHFRTIKLSDVEAKGLMAEVSTGMTLACALDIHGAPPDGAA